MADVAIIGGGAAGAALFGAMLARESDDVVHWVTGDAVPIGHGVAYRTDDPSHLLNVRASGMGLYLDADEEFATFGARLQRGAKPIDFLPRYLFGQYIDSQLLKRISVAKQRGRRYKLYGTQAIGLRTSADGYSILSKDGTRLTAQRVVLALGAMDARPLRTVSEAALDSGSYVLEPWSLAHRRITPRRITIIGTGLTAADTLITASHQWPDAELVAVSRHGLLPFTHPELPIAPFSGQADLNAALLAAADPAKALSAIRRVFRSHQDLDWRSVIDGMRPINSLLWQRFNARQRRQFLSHVRWLWESARHRLAPDAAQIIQQLRDEGRLHIHGARILAVDGDTPLTVTIRSRSTQRIATFESDIVVQATGLDTAVAFTKSPLLSSVLEEGLVTPDPLRLGLLANAGGGLINARGDTQSGLYAIGSLLRGSLWECTAMPEIRTMADALANAVTTPPADQYDSSYRREALI
jgi:uncharacterized NAD(P)/FAD-binding protein YdhS